MLLGFTLRFSVDNLDSSIAGPIQLVGTLTPLFWVGVLVVVGSYEKHVVGLGLGEYGRVIQSALWMVAIVSIISFFGKFDTSRGYVLLVLPIGLIGLLADRWLWRRWILRRRKRGLELQATLVVGDHGDAHRVVDAFLDRPWAGYRVVSVRQGPSAGNVSSWIKETAHEIERDEVTCVALTASCGLSGSDIRDLSWRIEGQDIDLLLSSTLGAVTGPRMTLRVATGLPFAHLDEVGLSSRQRVVKRLLDLFGAALLVLVLFPVMLLIAAGVRVTSGSPVMFRQQRAGFRGQVLPMWKFRTMRSGADSQRDELRQADTATAPTLKIADDPRITPIGRFLRRWSLDELPQLFNVLQGDMSLVGPRPHPFDDVERYRAGDSRRLLAKPGMTGLWQVAGRSDLAWEDAVELDLMYIENWSLIGDVAILLRTVQAVFSHKGAY